MKALHEARKEMATITAELRIKRALLSRVPRNINFVINPGNKVHVYQETDRKRIGPFQSYVQMKNKYLLFKMKKKNHTVYIRLYPKIIINIL